ncbi:MAG: phosphatidate cytidylyltransferase [Holosporales bacterium]|jgi:phosphatidate cytidylyltransferase|nr:phosphatidate cytidylyltransferase [Holosporales bacterium]
MNTTRARNSSNKELYLRFFSASVIVLLIVASIYLGETYFGVFVASLFGGIVFEWLNASGMKARGPGITALIGVTLLLAALLLKSWHVALVLWVAVCLIGVRRRCFDANSSSSFNSKRHRLAQFGLLYAAMSLWALGRAHCVCGKDFIMFVFACIWLTDTGAFFIGRIIGGPKLAPQISPKKTWSGALGGTALAAAGGAYLGVYLLGQLPLESAWIATELSLLAHFGDLLESAAKRFLGVKDMGRLVPGHGGLSDRFDSVLCVSFTYLLFIKLM